MYPQVRNSITQLTLACSINHLLLWRHLLRSFYDSVMAVKKFLGDRYGIDDLDEISKKIQCYKDFLDVMGKVDPGYSTVNVHFLLTGFNNQTTNLDIFLNICCLFWFVSGSCHYDWASNDKFSVFCLSTLITPWMCPKFQN